MAILQFSLTVPDDKRAGILQDFTEFHGYNEERDGTRAEFAKRLVADFVRSSVRNYRGAVAAEAARAAAVADVDKVGIT